MTSIKFSSLPMHVRTHVLDSFKEAKRTEANDRMRYYAQNGYSTAEEYREAVCKEVPTTADMKILIISSMTSLFAKYGFQAWMESIPNHAMICRRHMENVMLAKAGK